MYREIIEQKPFISEAGEKGMVSYYITQVENVYAIEIYLKYDEKSDSRSYYESTYPISANYDAVSGFVKALADNCVMPAHLLPLTDELYEQFFCTEVK